MQPNYCDQEHTPQTTVSSSSLQLLRSSFMFNKIYSSKSIRMSSEVYLQLQVFVMNWNAVWTWAYRFGTITNQFVSGHIYHNYVHCLFMTTSPKYSRINDCRHWITCLQYCLIADVIPGLFDRISLPLLYKLLLLVGHPCQLFQSRGNISRMKLVAVMNNMLHALSI